MYKRNEHVYDAYSRPIWDWVLDQLSNPWLAPHMHWDSRQLYQYDGESWIRFINEPFTASRAWNVQVCVLYAIAPDLIFLGILKLLAMFIVKITT